MRVVYQVPQMPAWYPERRVTCVPRLLSLRWFYRRRPGGWY